MKFALILLVMLLIPRSATAQHGMQVDVFLEYEQRQVNVYFTNPVTGLSSVAVVDDVPDDSWLLDRFLLSSNGVVFQNPVDNLPYLIAPNGSILRLEYIPQRSSNLLGVEWAISEDGRTIAWAELYFEAGIWQATLYTASLDGTELRQLPPLPDRSRLSSTRVAMVAVSSAGDRVFVDMEHPTEPRRPDDAFVDYRQLWAYLDTTRDYRQLRSEVDCLCPAKIAHNGRTYVRLEQPIVGSGYGVRIWDLDTNFNRLVPPIETDYRQAGHILISDNGEWVVYALSGGNAETNSAVVVVDMLEATQRMIVAPAGQEWRPRALINRDEELIVVDIAGGVTYKMNLRTERLDLVANKLWLGVLEG